MTSLESRITIANDAEMNFDGKYVLYWMVSTRRFHYNAALQHAAEMAKQYDVPLVVLEAISISHPYANDRIISFMIEGMVENIEIFKENNVRFIPWVQTPLQGPGGLLRSLSKNAIMVVTDDFPTYKSKWVVEDAKSAIKIPLHIVDSNGAIPLDWPTKAYPTAHSFRRFIHDKFVESIETWPKKSPVEKGHDLWMDDEQYNELVQESGIVKTPLEWLWRVCEKGKVGIEALAVLDIDHSVPPVKDKSGGTKQANSRMNTFLQSRIDRYHTDRNEVSKPATSGLSPWFHFGHISTIELIQKVLNTNDWSPHYIDPSRRGSRSGWWGLPEPIESFLDQIITWRELGFNFAHNEENHTSIESIPDWAKLTLSLHQEDRSDDYTLQELENARTEDEIWNAAQRQLLQEGIIHNYLRMVWGKRILEWAPDAKTASEWMIYLNDKWALDGRDPNSYTGIFWVLGRHDRAWGPERPIFGKVRYMSSANTARKFNLKPYLSRFAGGYQSNLFSN